MERPLRLLVYALFLLSGGTALVYQVTWLRDLSLIFGASFQATSIVLASFMGGMALGGFAFGRRSERLRHPLRVYGLLEIGIAAFALVLPSLLRAVDELYVATALAAGEVTPTINLMRVALSFGVLVLPTFLMGATLPVLIRFIVNRYGDLGPRLAFLYGINTLGAACGALAAGFVLMPAFGVSRTQLLAVAVNLAIGLLAVLADRRPTPAAVPRHADAGDGAGDVARDLGAWPARLAFWGTAVSGLSALALEVMWTRSLALSVGSTTYSFTVMLASFLIGIWLGSWLHAVVPLRRVNEALQLGFVLVAIGATSFAVSQWIPRLPELVLHLNIGVFEDTTRVRTVTSLLSAFAVMLVPCIFMGIAFPLAGQARARLALSLGGAVGDTVGLNTLGAITGSLLAGFVLIPGLGLQRGMLTIAMLLVGYGLVVLAACAAARAPRPRAVVAAGAAAALALVILVPRLVPPWDMSLLGSFASNMLGNYVVDDGFRVLDPRKEVLYFEEGRTSTVSIVDVRKSTRYISVNGKIVASDSMVDLAIQLILGHVPVLLHPDPESVLVVGFGAGVTLGSVSTHDYVDQLTLVEIEPAVLGGGHLFGHVNNHVLEDPRLEVVIQDGRNFLKTTSRRFDVITADPIHPWSAGSAYLYTTEYYELAAQHLNEGGIMCQWVPLSELSVENFRSIVRSFADNFEYVSIWDSAYDVALIGSDRPPDVSVARLKERLEIPAVREQLDLFGLADAVSFLARLGAETLGMRAYARNARLNTDDNLYIEFSSPLAIGTLCEAGTMCGLATYYPGRLETVGDWSPLFASSRDGTEAVVRHRNDRNAEELKTADRLTRRRLRSLREQRYADDGAGSG